ncbi:hypothetical protein AnigIFM60653_003099 [Aspergillus niger]|nr:hypothetical protein AnigIFM50267_000949 [Aspergillus niger]GLA03466.1 hypothetical protein AnigIFM60653_003099 [Aspergillus niger]GLA11686.1 hypothetical protein AnigIFM62618_005656 [Aspergillus niger]GLA43154.1 hypothetical protein AnigIFM63309_000880 [Aspergillus niger]
MQRLTSQYTALRMHILSTTTPATATYDSVIRPLAALDNAINCDLQLLYMLQYGVPDKATQDAFVEARQKLIETETAWMAREDFHALLEGWRGRDSSERGQRRRGCG